MAPDSRDKSGRVRRRQPRGILRPLNRRLARLERSRWTFVLIGLLSFFLNAAITLYTGIPQPATHDEFSYLLAADTFAHGRLTNPPHPLWDHLEAVHVLGQPTYQSKYQPGQGLILALGQVLTGQPIVGAWLASALAAAAICWALRAWVGPRWALLAGILAATHVLILFWAQNYWGGSLAAAAGALVLGAAGRMRRHPTACLPAMAALAAAGFILLLETRPYEGTLFTLLLTPLLPWRRILHSPRILAAALAVLAAGGAWIGYYNWRVTGNPLLLPYLLYEKQYSEVPGFVWMDLPPRKSYRNDILRVMEDQMRTVFQAEHASGAAMWNSAEEKLAMIGRGYLYWSVGALGLLALPWLLWSQRRWRWPAAALLLFVAVLPLTTFAFAHYAAPAFALLVAIEIAGLRSVLDRTRLARPAMLALAIISAALAWNWVARRAQAGEGWGKTREQLIQALEQNPGDDLVFVHYRRIANLNHDWVANGAEIDRQRVVFARDMGPAENLDLIGYFAGRHLWLLNVTGDQAVLEPYPALPETQPAPVAPATAPSPAATAK